MADIKREPISWQRNLISACGVVFTVHILGAMLYAAALSPAFQAKYGLLSGTQFHLMLATLSLPLALITAHFERRLKRLLGYLVIRALFVLWIFTMVGVFIFIPEGKVVLVPTQSSSGGSPADTSQAEMGKTR